LSVRPAPHVRSWRAAVFTVFLVNGFALATWVSRTPALRDELGLGIAQMGLLILAGSVASIVGLTLGPAVMRRFGGRRTLLGSMAVDAAGLVVLGLGSGIAGSPVVAALGLAVWGFGTGLCDVTMNVEGADVERETGRTLLPLLHAAFSIGTIGGAALGSLVVLAGVAVEVHFAAVAVVVALVTAVAVRAVPVRAPAEVAVADAREDAPAAGGGWATRLHVLLEPRIVLIGLIALGMAFAEGAANDWLALALTDERGFGEAAAAGALALFTTGMTVGRIAGGPVIDRFGRVAVLRVSAVLAGAGLLTVILVDDDVVTLVAVVVWGLGAAVGFPVAISAAADDPARQAVSVSAVATVGYGAFLAGPPLIGFAGEHIGLLPSLLGIVALIAVAGLVAGAARPRTAVATEAGAAGGGARAH
jgi:predicted MFS family arabinose efflux permease